MTGKTEIASRIPVGCRRPRYMLPRTRAMGTPVYSSAVVDFIPKTAMDFDRAVATDDVAAQNRLPLEALIDRLGPQGL